jgi:GMP synthase (glutamine-hydrolysing)
LILHRAIGHKLTCTVDNGVLRLNEAAQIVKRFERLNLPPCSSTRRRISRPAADVTEPEQKRKIIGATFIDVFEAEAA